MTNPNQLTAAERRCLGNLIALGGVCFTSNGADRGPGYVRTNTVRRLQAAGLVRGESLACAYTHGGSWYPYTCFRATAAGCVAYGAEIARVS